MLTFQSDSPRIHGHFHLEAGIVGVIGLSGSGKTSLFRLLTGLDRNETTSVQVNDQPLQRIAVWHRPIAYVPQKPSLIPHRTVASQLQWIRGNSPVSLDAWAEILDVAKLISRYPGELSGGEQQRVALLRALMADRPILLLDEALSGVDRPHRTAIFQKLVEWWPNDRLLLFSTHDWDEAERFSQQLLYVEQSCLYAPIPQREIRPLTENMAHLMGFIGLLSTPQGKVFLHPDLMQAGTVEGALFIPGELTVSDLGALQSAYDFHMADQNRRWRWNGPKHTSGQFQGVSLTHTIWGASDWRDW